MTDLVEDPFGLDQVLEEQEQDVPVKDVKKESSAVIIQSAPEVSLSQSSALTKRTDTKSSRILYENLPYEEMMKPMQGPVNVYAKPMDDIKNTRMGYVEALYMPANEFEDQRRTFKEYGYAIDPTNSYIIGNKRRAEEYDYATVSDPVKVKEKKKRYPKGDPSKIDGYLGPWAGYEGEAVNEDVVVSLETIEKPKPEKTEKKDEDEITNEECLVHAGEERDYLGRGFLHPPADVDYDLTKDPSSHECFLPKKLIHTYSGHTRGVNVIKFFPNSGHLLISGSMDNTVKLWDVFHERKCFRTYIGHSKPVKDVIFDHDGSHFFTSSFDKWIKHWDTEAGKCVVRLKYEKMANCLAVNPENVNILLTGMSDGKILQWDLRSEELVQTYDQHLGAVNCLSYVDQGRRFISTSDDKSIRMWENDIPTAIKCIADPSLQSMPCIANHPISDWTVFQSLANHVLVYSSEEKLKLHRKKRFTGHSTAGYACKIDFSPDGKYLLSGDAGGHYVIWDWKTCKVLKKQKVHEQVAIGVAWNPQLPSTIATCSWDSKILLFE